MSGLDLSVRVECYAGYRGEQAPTRFYMGTREVAVVDVVDRWLGPKYRYFKLRGSDGGVYILRNNTAKVSWELTLFDSGTREDTRLSCT